MSDIRFNRWLHQSGTGGIHQDSSGNIGIGTSVPTVKVDVQGGDLKVGDQIFSSSGVSTFSSGLNVTGGSVGIGTVNPDHNLHIFKSAGDAVITIESTGNGNDSALEFVRTSSAGDRRGAGSIYVTGDTGATEAKMHFGVGHNISHGQVSRMTIMGNGEVGIGTDNPSSKLTVDGYIESSGDGSYASTSEGGQIVLRAPRGQPSGTKYRYAIDNYWGETSYGRATSGSNDVSGIRFVREDDNSAANGQVLMSLAEDGIMHLPYQPAFDAVYDAASTGMNYATANTEIVFNATNNNRGNHFSTTTGRFTAPITGTYFFSIGGMSNSSTQPVWFELRVNGNLLTNPHNPYMSVQNGSGYRHITSQYTLQLNDGDYVSVFTGGVTGGLYGGGNNHNHFVGYLIG